MDSTRAFAEEKAAQVALNRIYTEMEQASRAASAPHKIQYEAALKRYRVAEANAEAFHVQAAKRRRQDEKAYRAAAQAARDRERHEEEVRGEKNRQLIHQKKEEIDAKQKELQEKRARIKAICDRHDKIIVELKAASALTGEHEAQVLNYLKASRSKLGLLVNFGTPALEYRRLVL